MLNNSYQVVYVNDVRTNIKDAKRWYKNQQNGLEKRFALAIREAIERLIANPYAFAIRYRDIRIIHPNIFPFSIHFYINEATRQIVLVAVVHEYMDITINE